MKNKFARHLLIKRKGSSLALVLVVFMIITILLSSMIVLFNANLKEATYQENKMKTHYLALSGIDITKSTLLMPVAVVDSEEISMIEYIKQNPDSYLSMEDSLEIDGKTVDIDFSYDKTEKIATITSRAEYDEHVSSKLTLRMDVKTSKYREFWD